MKGHREELISTYFDPISFDGGHHVGLGRKLTGLEIDSIVKRALTRVKDIRPTRNAN